MIATLKKVSNNFSTIAPVMREAAKQTRNFGELLAIEDYKPKNPCTIGPHEERRAHRLYYRRNPAARYELSNPNSSRFDQRGSYIPAIH